jgi:hypothetical protein
VPLQFSTFLSSWKARNYRQLFVGFLFVFWLFFLFVYFFKSMELVPVSCLGHLCLCVMNLYKTVSMRVCCLAFQHFCVHIFRSSCSLNWPQSSCICKSCGSIWKYNSVQPYLELRTCLFQARDRVFIAYLVQRFYVQV